MPGRVLEQTAANVDIEQPVPDPNDCLPPGEKPLVITKLSPGWIAVTDREFFACHPNRDPIVTRTFRSNVTQMSVRRSGGGSVFGYVPAALLYAVAALFFGVLLRSLTIEELLSIPDAPGAGQIETIVQTLGLVTGHFGTALVLTGILTGLSAIAVVTHWFFSRDVVFVLERGEADPIECRTTRTVGIRALREIESELAG